jgi:hypothetical protein
MNQDIVHTSVRIGVADSFLQIDIFMVNNLNIHTSMKLLLQFVQKLPFFPLKRSIFFVQSKFQIIPENSSTFFRFFMTKNLIFRIKFDVKIMEACAKEIILKKYIYQLNKCYSWYFYLETGHFVDSAASFSLAS